MEKLMKAKEEIIEEINELENTSIHELIEEKVNEFRVEITEKIEKEKQDNLNELYVGLKYIERAIERETKNESVSRETEVVHKIEENPLTNIII